MNRIIKNSNFAAVLAILAGALLVAAAGPVSAQATRTWVSGVGDDANPCSRTAPCKTFAGAISKTAANGEINCLDPGGFGAVTITKSLVIDCTGTQGSILNAGTNGINISSVSGTDNVILRNISIDGAGTGLNGINILRAANVHIENVTIRGQSLVGINFVPNVNSTLFVERTYSRNNTVNGMVVKPAAGMAARAFVAGSRLDGNGSAGIRVDDGGLAMISDTRVQGNGANGIVAVSASTEATIVLERVVASGNTFSGVVANGAAATVRMSEVMVSYNKTTGLSSVSGGALVSFGNNRAVGNVGGNGSATTPLAQF